MVGVVGGVCLGVWCLFVVVVSGGLVVVGVMLWWFDLGGVVGEGSVSSGERKRRRLNQMRVRGGGRCVFGVVGPCWILLPGGRAV